MDYQMEKEWAEWLMYENDDELFQSLLSVIEPANWSLDSKELSEWEERIKKEGRYCLKEKRPPVIWEQTRKKFHFSCLFFREKIKNLQRESKHKKSPNGNFKNHVSGLWCTKF